MPSNEYSGIPAVARLHLTSGDVIDLLDASGLCITYPNGWVPKITELKGGGVKVESQSTDDNWLVAGGYGAVEESFPLKADPNFLARRLEHLQRFLWQAEQYSLTDWQRDTGYLAVKLKEDSELRYARIKRGSFQFGQYAFGRRTGLPDNTLVLEREPFWHANPPGEIAGPFTNWIPNPSFEFWRDEGIVGTRPSGWYEQSPANRPTGGYISREDAKIAGPHHALKIGFTDQDVGGPTIWGVRTQTSWPGSVEAHTLRYWIHIVGASANDRVRIFLRDSAGGSVSLTQYAADFTGWVYTPVAAPIDAAGFYEMVVSWNFVVVTHTAAELVIDRVTLTRGTWTADTWPGDFYMGCGTVWGWEDDENYYAPKLAAAENWHFINHLDVSGVPGDVDAEAVIAIDRLGSLYGEDKNWPLLKYWLAQRREDPAMLGVDDGEHISLNIDPVGYTGADYTAVGDETSSETIVQVELDASETWRRVVAFRSDAHEETKEYAGRFRFVARVRWDPDEGYESQNCRMQLVYWIGSQVNAITLDEVEIADTDYFRLIHFTPRDYIDWNVVKDRGATLAFAIKVQMDGESGTGDLWIDLCTLLSTESGLVNVEFEEASPWNTSMSLSLDSRERILLPVAITAPHTDEWIMDADLARVAGVTCRSWDAQTFNGSLYVCVAFSGGGGGTNLFRFDHRGWVNIGLTATWAPDGMEVWEGQLYIGTLGSLRAYHPDGGHYTAWGFNEWDLHAFGGFLWASTTGGNGSRYTHYLGARALVNWGGDDIWCFETYKRKLYAAGQAGAFWVYDTINGWTNLGPILAGADILAMKKWRDKLYITGNGIGVYSWDGTVLTQVLAHDAAWGTETCLQVYNGRLYMGAGDNANDIHILYTEDEANWEEHIFPFAARVGVMQPFDGRLFIGPGTPHANASYPSGYVATSGIWHTAELSKLHTVKYTGGEMTLPPRRSARLYQRMEALNVETGNGDAPDEYIVRPDAESDERGPQTQFSISFDARWRSLRGE